MLVSCFKLCKTFLHICTHPRSYIFCLPLFPSSWRLWAPWGQRPRAVQVSIPNRWPSSRIPAVLQTLAWKEIFLQVCNTSYQILFKLSHHQLSDMLLFSVSLRNTATHQCSHLNLVWRWMEDASQRRQSAEKHTCPNWETVEVRPCYGFVHLQMMKWLHGQIFEL